MNKKFLLSILIIVVSLGVLIYSGVTSTAKAVVTVAQLEQAGSERARVRLGARVADGDISYQTSPQFVVKFNVKDPVAAVAAIPVVYYGLMPDTLKVGRDVILEGDYDGQQFVAKSLLTQCPSKYEPPVPKG